MTPSEFREDLGTQKTRMNWLSCGEEIMTIYSAVLIGCQRVTDGRTDRQTDGRTDGRTDVKPIAITCFSIADARKKTFTCYISRIWGEKNPGRICTKFCTGGDIQNVITAANLGDDRLSRFCVARGQILGFSIGFRSRPYNTLALPCECVIKVFLLSALFFEIA